MEWTWRFNDLPTLYIVEIPSGVLPPLTYERKRLGGIGAFQGGKSVQTAVLYSFAAFARSEYSSF